MGVYGSPDLSQQNKYDYIRCKNCGFEFPSSYKSCPNCSHIKTNSGSSALGILALVFSILFFPVGFILSIVDLSIKKNNKKVLSIIALVISSCILFFSLLGVLGSNIENESLSQDITNDVFESQVSSSVPQVGSSKTPSNNQNNVSAEKDDNNAAKKYPSLAHKNAVAKAREYLSFSAFSYEGLIKQLEFEKYSSEQAKYGVDNCNADWNKQALRKAKEYLDFSAFSHDGLVRQLEFEGFTHEQAKYGADNCNADWNKQALRKAKEYLDFSAFSHDGLVQQLEFEGFTHEQAEYGVTNIGL